jgi:protein subunit release factor A
MASVIPSSRGAAAIVSRVVCRRPACRRRSSLDGCAVGIGTVIAPPPFPAAVLAGRRRSATDADDGAGGDPTSSRGGRSALRRNFTVATTMPHRAMAAAGGGGWRTIVARHSPSSTTTRDDDDDDPPVLRRLRHRSRLRWTDAPSSPFSSAARRPTPPLSSSPLDDDDDDDPAGDDGLDSLPALSPAMLGRIRALRSRHDEVMELLRSEGGGGPDQSALGRELSSLSGLSSACDAVRELRAERRSLAELLDETTSGDGDGGDRDPSSREMIEEIEWELDQIDSRLRVLSRKMMMSIVPIFDPEDAGEVMSSDAVIDIRAGTGGDEACLFAGEILAAYEAIAKAGGDSGDDDDHAGGGKSWDVEVLSVSRTGLGGVKEASLVVSSRGGGGGGGGGHTGGFDGGGGPEEDDAAGLVLRRLGPYGFFRYESGVHRVQRVPVNGELASPLRLPLSIEHECI